MLPSSLSVEVGALKQGEDMGDCCSKSRSEGLPGAGDSEVHIHSTHSALTGEPPL